MTAKRMTLRGLALALVLAAVVAVPSPASASATLNLWGPSSITTSGNYTYTAQFGVLYVSFQWFTRSCNVSTLGCTAWVQQWDAAFFYPDRSELTRHLTISCTPPKNLDSFQVQVIGSGFATPPQTAYKTTNLCPPEPL